MFLGMPRVLGINFDLSLWVKYICRLSLCYFCLARIEVFQELVLLCKFRFRFI